MPPLETMALSTVGVSRCGEVFVTNNADKWTFFCSYCQQSINDIGVFICHIRLDHLDSVHDFQAEEVDTVKPEVETEYCETSAPDHMPTAQGITVSPSASEGVKCKTLIKDEETLSQFSFDSQTFNPRDSKAEDIDSIDCNEANNDSNKNAFDAYISSDESNENILPTGKDSQDEEFITIEGNNEPIQVDFENNDEIIDIDDIDDDIEEIFDSDESNQNNEDANKATESSLTQNLLMYNCHYCARHFTSTRGLHCHQIQVHREKYLKKLQHKCKICNKAFKSERSLKHHLIMHDKTNLLQCQVCFVNLFRMSSFLQHVMKHESDKCFPCQTCGKVFNSNEERETHWETHAKDKPFACSTCFRRFSKDYFLERHLSTHGKYSCHFCSKYFNAAHQLRYPYICPDCGKLPDIKQVAEQLQSDSHKKTPQ